MMNDYPRDVAPRYELRTGKFGPYFHDTRGSGWDMPLQEVLNTLNRYALRKAQLTWFVETHGEPGREPQPVGGGWKTIETAPKDGTPVDLWVPPHGRITEQWYDKDDGWFSLPDCQPTHWMPLPPPPELQSAPVGGSNE